MGLPTAGGTRAERGKHCHGRCHEHWSTAPHPRSARHPARLPMTTTAAPPVGSTTTTSTPSREAGGLGWLASSSRLIARTAATVLPWLPFLVIAGVAAVIGLVVLGVAVAGHGPGVGHGMAGLVTGLVALAVTVSPSSCPTSTWR